MSIPLRGLPPDQQELYDAYVAATGRALYLSTARRFMLRQLAERNVTAADVKEVIGFIRRKIARGDGGFTEASLDFRNAMEPDSMEDRMWRVREAKGRAKGDKAKPVVARTDKLPDGSTVSRLAEKTTETYVPAAGALIDSVARAFGRKQGDAVRGE
jgi:hypothetical protein